MAKKIKAENLKDEISKILQEYADSVDENVSDATIAVTKLGVKAVKAEAKEKFNGSEYSKGWTSKIERGRLHTSGTIYNSKMPGLPHLLEFGHALVKGGRTIGQVNGRAHIEPVEREITERFEKEIRAKI